MDAAVISLIGSAVALAGAAAAVWVALRTQRMQSEDTFAIHCLTKLEEAKRTLDESDKAVSSGQNPLEDLNELANSRLRSARAALSRIGHLLPDPERDQLLETGKTIDRWSSQQWAAAAGLDPMDLGSLPADNEMYEAVLRFYDAVRAAVEGALEAHVGNMK